jgi:hypothetical protein
MAKKTIGYVELAWTCPRCETENPGPRKFCTGCGAPQPDDVQFHQLENAVLLTEEADILRAKAGPDVHCPYCHARNPGDAEFCGACGGDLEDAEARESGQVIGAFRKNKGLERECPHCGTLNTSDALECSGCGASLAVRREERTVEVPATSPSRSSLPKFAGIGCLAILLVGAAVLIFSLFRKEELTATVRQVEWTYTIPILALTPVEQEAWYDEVPSEAESVSCREELRERRDEAVPGALEVCGTPYTIDEGSGYGEVVQDCIYEVYDDYCDYTIMDWIEIDSVSASGNDLDPYWPVFNLQGDQQTGEGEAEYAVIFSSGNESYRYYPDDEIEFSRFDRGSTWLIEVNQLGGVSVIEPAR